MGEQRENRKPSEETRQQKSSKPRSEAIQAGKQSGEPKKK